MPGFGWRVKPLPIGWTATVARILLRDGRVCYRCGRWAGEVDHVVPASQGGGEDDTNLAAICTACHRKKTSAEAHAARIPRKRPVEEHPGWRREE